MNASRTLDDGLADARGACPPERVLFGLAATMTLIAAGLGAFVSRWFLLLAVLVGFNQWLYAIVGWCPASLILRRSSRCR